MPQIRCATHTCKDLLVFHVSTTRLEKGIKPMASGLRYALNLELIFHGGWSGTATHLRLGL
jgi:hypothetical protein